MKTLAFKEGTKVAKTGGKATDNPYKSISAFDREQTQAYKDWLDGYLNQKGYHP